MLDRPISINNDNPALNLRTRQAFTENKKNTNNSVKKTITKQDHQHKNVTTNSDGSDREKLQVSNSSAYGNTDNAFCHRFTICNYISYLYFNSQMSN